MDHGVGPCDPCPCGSGRKFKFCCYKSKMGIARPATATKPENAGSSPKRKMSEMILEMAAGFFVGNTDWREAEPTEHSLFRLEYACASPEVRQYQLEQYGAGYLKFNPATSPTDLDNIIKDMKTLIERKLRMFPDDRRQIVSAKAVKVGETFRVEVASATVQ